MFEIKYYLNGVELKNDMKLKCKMSAPLGYFTKVLPVVIKHNKLYVKWQENDLREVDNSSYIPIEICN